MGITKQEQMEREQLELDNATKKIDLERSKLAFEKDQEDVAREEIKATFKFAKVSGEVTDKLADSLRKQFLEWEIDTQHTKPDILPVVTVLINSFGGHVHSGLDIYDMLLEYRSKGWTVNTKITGAAMSMASVIAQAGTERQMTRHATFMIHASHGWYFGTTQDVRDHLKWSDDLNNHLASILAHRSVWSTEEVKLLWDRKDVFMNAEETKADGFVDRIIALCLLLSVCMVRYTEARSRTQVIAGYGWVGFRLRVSYHERDTTTCISPWSYTECSEPGSRLLGMSR